MLAFVRYDVSVARRNNKLIQDAARSNAVVTSLFPGSMRDRVLDAARVGSGSAPSKRLKSFLVDANPDEADGADRPLAELFLDCSVVFADVSISDDKG